MGALLRKLISQHGLEKARVSILEDGIAPISIEDCRMFFACSWRDSSQEHFGFNSF
jgi:hypothetical protein